MYVSKALEECVVHGKHKREHVLNMFANITYTLSSSKSYL